MLVAGGPDTELRKNAVNGQSQHRQNTGHETYRLLLLLVLSVFLLLGIAQAPKKNANAGLTSLIPVREFALGAPPAAQLHATSGHYRAQAAGKVREL